MKTENDDEVPYPENGREAWRRLQRGNRRFMNGDVEKFMSHLSPQITPKVRKNLIKGQRPYGIKLLNLKKKNL